MAAQPAGETRMNGRRLIVYLLLNALVSAVVTLTVLWVWDRTHTASPLNPSVTFTATPPAAPAANTPAGPVAEAPTHGPLPTPTVYTVKAGDSLGSIATTFDVSVEDIMAANNLTDANVISVGATLLIPVAGSVPPTAPPGTSAPEPTVVVEPPRATATRDPNVALPHLTIRSVQSAGVLADEVLLIVNDGGPVDLAGWSLRDETGHSYTFPSLMLFEGGAVSLHTAAGADSVTDLYWNLAEPVWEAGKDVLLSDAAGNLHTRFSVP
jgi:LysM repeat protein